MGLRNRGADREAEPGTALLRREERFEDTVEQLGRHAGPRVDDGHARVRLGHSHLDPERATRRRGLVGVHQEVQEELAELGVIAADHGRRGRNRHGDGNGLFLEGGPHGLHRLGDRDPQVERLAGPVARP